MMVSVPKSIQSRARDRDLIISVRIGRNGLTESLVDEMNDQLAKRGLVKVKANRGLVEGSAERNELFSALANQTNSILVFQRGNVAVYWTGA